MSEAFAVVRKDFSICGKTILMIMVVLTLAMRSMGADDLFLVLLFIPVMSGIMCFFLDPPDSLAVFALPVRRKFLVAGRYISIALVFFASLVLYVFLAFWFRRSPDYRALSFICVAIVFCLSIMVPLYFGLPHKWALGITTVAITMIACIALGFAIVLTKDPGQVPSFLAGIWNFPFFPPVSCLLAIALYLGSLTVSLGIISRKVL